MSTASLLREWDYRDFLLAMHPGLFERPYIRSMDEEKYAEDLLLALDAWNAGDYSLPPVPGISYGFYHGPLDDLRRVVAEVEEHWPDLFNEGDEVYCAFDGDRIASFAIVTDMGSYRGLKIGGPGCVGTVPAYRRRGIGLRLVKDVTRLLKDRGYDVSYIFYTSVTDWYRKLGYRRVLRWNRDGITGTWPYPS